MLLLQLNIKKLFYFREKLFVSYIVVMIEDSQHITLFLITYNSLLNIYEMIIFELKNM